MSRKKKALRKPTGTTGPISVGPEGITRDKVIFPDSKEEIELLIANGFCVPGRVSYVPHIKRYSHFCNLRQQRENSLDFTVMTGLGARWLELCEFAPLEKFGGKYELVPERWDAGNMLKLFLELIAKKSSKLYNGEIILLIYKTHRTLFVPAPVLRAACRELKQQPPLFESIYYISPHSMADMSVWEVWPGANEDDGWAVSQGTFVVGP